MEHPVQHIGQLYFLRLQQVCKRLPLLTCNLHLLWYHKKVCKLNPHHLDSFLQHLFLLEQQLNELVLVNLENRMILHYNRVQLE